MIEVKRPLLLNIFCPYCGHEIIRPNIIKRAIILSRIRNLSTSFLNSVILCCKTCADLR